MHIKESLMLQEQQQRLFPHSCFPTGAETQHRLYTRHIPHLFMPSPVESCRGNSFSFLWLESIQYFAHALVNWCSKPSVCGRGSAPTLLWLGVGARPADHTRTHPRPDYRHSPLFAAESVRRTSAIPERCHIRNWPPPSQSTLRTRLACTRALPVPLYTVKTFFS